jgi:hypothetical protein
MEKLLDKEFWVKVNSQYQEICFSHFLCKAVPAFSEMWKKHKLEIRAHGLEFLRESGLELNWAVCHEKYNPLFVCIGEVYMSRFEIRKKFLEYMIKKCKENGTR